MANVFFKYCFICALPLHLATAWAANPNDPPPNSSFSLNFLPINTWDGQSSKNKIFAACGIGSLPIGAGSKGDQMCDDNKGGPSGYKGRFVHDGYIPGTTLYLQEVDKDSGIWHQVLIDNVENFKMDIYINMGMGTAGLGQGRSMSGGKNSGHVYPIDPKRQDLTGTGTGDPTRVQYRMLIEQQDFKMDTVKDSWNRKPKITQQITGPNMKMNTLIDMSNSSYSDMFTPGIVTHTTEITGLPAYNFDSRTSPSSYITAGRFKISSSSGDAKDPTYTYVGAAKDYGKNLNWLEYWHGSRNPAYWQPGESYGYGGSNSDDGEGEEKNWGP
ncbi:MAG: hypothetical protein U1B30_09950 [Pseudomonadota bacterium]|nr:hypothetical protein [Pseudomonadota bacterium]